MYPAKLEISSKNGTSSLKWTPMCVRGLNVGQIKRRSEARRAKAKNSKCYWKGQKQSEGAGHLSSHAAERSNVGTKRGVKS